MGRRILSPLLILIAIVACTPQEEKSNESQNGKVKILLFLNPECPLCQSYSITIKELRQEFGGEFIWTAVFPGEWIVRDSVSAYLRRYQLNFEEVIYDKDLKLANECKATITPSVYIFRDDRLLYRGRIDDWAIETGIKKLVPQEHDLKNALQDLKAGREIKVKETKAIGCLIE